MINKNELDFAVFCIENIADRLNLNGADVYNMLDGSKILDDYIKRCIRRAKNIS